jgi:hypothetical protein
MGTGSFPGVKWPERGVDHPSSSAEVKERVELYLYSPSGPVLGEFYLYLYWYELSDQYQAQSHLPHTSDEINAWSFISNSPYALVVWGLIYNTESPPVHYSTLYCPACPYYQSLIFV